LLAIAAVVLASPLHAQVPSRHGQPKQAFGVADFAKLKWLEGVWEATSPDEPTLYQRYRFVDDSTIAITYYRDPSLTQETGNGKLYLTVGRVYHTFGPSRWAATRVDSAGLYFVPQVTARNSFSWEYNTPDTWTSTMRSGIGGHDRVTVYHMKRVK
jgi:hypothetical protein